MSDLLRKMGMTPRQLLREKGTPYAELGLADSKWTDDELIDFMMAHPILINRPIVETPKGVAAVPAVGEGAGDPAECEYRAIRKGRWRRGRRAGVSMKPDLSDLPNVSAESLILPDPAALRPAASQHKPRILMLYGSLRERSYSRFLTMEAAQLLEAFGAETRIFNPSGLPLPDDAPSDHPKVQELRELSAWSEGQVWCSPERHGAMTGIMKAQIDWIPLSIGVGAADPGQDAGRHAGQRRIAVLQRRQPAARARPLDADDHHPQSVVGGEGLSSNSTRPAG